MTACDEIARIVILCVYFHVVDFILIFKYFLGSSRGPNTTSYFKNQMVVLCYVFILNAHKFSPNELG